MEAAGRVGAASDAIHASHCFWMGGGNVFCTDSGRAFHVLPYAARRRGRELGVDIFPVDMGQSVYRGVPQFRFRSDLKGKGSELPLQS